MDISIPRILQLPFAIANQIAAGEVIERPASVVKELLENALDAKATMINIEIGFGGLNQIKLSDNGVGIVAEDLPLAIEAHATSKITQLNDLYAIQSMGFRGEALASIAAVSRLTLISRPANQDHAMMLRCQDSMHQLIPCARNQGTTIEVLDLFCTAPVRKKFLKSALSEYQAIESLVKRFALSAPWVSITLSHNDKLMLQLPAATCEKTKLQRIKKLLGKSFIEQSYYLDVERGPMRLQGFISGLSYQRSQNDKQLVYLNQRMVKDKLINHAIKQAYEDKLHPGRYPSCLLYFTLPAEEVDVNVHPTKHEVRFQQPRLVHDFILSTISKASSPVNCITAPSSVYEVREEYVEKPLQTMPIVMSSTTANWCILNQHFIIISQHGLSFLINVEKVQQERLLAILEQQPRPLASRPLLVPVVYDVEHFGSDYRHPERREGAPDNMGVPHGIRHDAVLSILEQYQASLAQIGLQIDKISATKMVVRTIPQWVPYLDIKKFLENLSLPLQTSSQLLHLLVMNQSFDVNYLESEEREALQDYIQQHLTTPSLPNWCLCLDQKKCRELMND